SISNNKTVTQATDRKLYFEEYISPILTLQGDRLPVSAFSPDGSVPTGTSRLEKHGVAYSVPKWIPENCIQCNQCSFVCPHACIRPFLIDEAADSPEEFVTIPALQIPKKRLRIQVSVHDCMGCELCARVCPAKEKALVMTPVNELQTREGNNWDFAQSLPTLEERFYNLKTVKGSQFRQPLFEFSYACAGCGETPYVKLLTQLFGNRLLIANATGCSSIYGGSSPTCPYATDQNGRGPAWANSLFEDNAEFGLGMRLSYDQRVDGKEKTVWCVGGDGWAYDIGYGGLDHVLASGKNVNVLVLDSEVYSNTGGQASKATPLGAVARFAAGGKRIRKKPLALMTMQYQTAYVAQVCLGANMQQLVKALTEAEAFDGPSLIIAYTPCIAHGVSMSKSIEEERLAVDCGYWHLFRYDPRLIAEGKNPFQLDSKAPTKPIREFLYSENRFASLKKSNPQAAEALFKQAEQESKTLFSVYKRLAEAENKS
ncbi:MAG: 4Fe-4S dicluster domain-containing protein, partial [Clostridia bacterium]|nr:4Fe-4S dicluster domain-containing protein [Clostridia bacterium]